MSYVKATAMKQGYHEPHFKVSATAACSHSAGVQSQAADWYLSFLATGLLATGYCQACGLGCLNLVTSLAPLCPAPSLVHRGSSVGSVALSGAGLASSCTKQIARPLHFLASGPYAAVGPISLPSLELTHDWPGAGWAAYTAGISAQGQS